MWKSINQTVNVFSQTTTQWNSGVGACLVVKSYPTLCDPMNYSLSCSSVHGILQARILEWVAMPSSRGSSWPRNLHLFLLHWQVSSLPPEPPGKPKIQVYFIVIVLIPLSCVQPGFKSSGCHIGPCGVPCEEYVRGKHTARNDYTAHPREASFTSCHLSSFTAVWDTSDWLTGLPDWLEVPPGSAHSRSLPRHCLDFSKEQPFYKDSPVIFNQRPCLSWEEN